MCSQRQNSSGSNRNSREFGRGRMRARSNAQSMRFPDVHEYMVYGRQCRSAHAAASVTGYAGTRPPASWGAERK